MSTYDEQSNSYGEPAGPGFKRRNRMRLTEIPKRIARPKRERPRYQTPSNEKAAQERVKVTARGLTNRIIRETLANASFSDVYDQLQKANYPGSAVLVSSERNRTMNVLRIMLEEGVISQDTLDEYRRKCGQEQRSR